MMDAAKRLQTLLRLSHMGLVKVEWDGHYRVTPEGRELLDGLDVLRELDDRPDAARSRETSHAPRAVTPPGGARAGDEGRARRAARKQRT